MLWCTIEVKRDSCWSRLSLRPGPHLRATCSRYGTIWSKKGTQRIPRLLKINLGVKEVSQTGRGPWRQ